MIQKGFPITAQACRQAFEISKAKLTGSRQKIFRNTLKMPYNYYRLKLRSFFSLFFLFQSLTLAQSEVGLRVIDESAIPYMEFLSKAEFDQRFPGEIKSDSADLDSGWYVIYTHENLNYHFGPILLESTGRDYLLQLNKIVEAAVEQRPEIEGFQLVLSYEPSTVSSGNTVSGNGSGGDREGSVGSGNEDQPSEKPPSTGFWAFVRRIFGF